MFDELEVGDDIEWWTDAHGRNVEPDDPEAVRRSGTVDSMHHHPDDQTRVVACLVACQGGVSGTYLATIRPDHRLTVRRIQR